MTAKEKIICRINDYCQANETDVVQGSLHIFLPELSEYDNVMLLKDLVHDGIIQFDDLQVKVTQLYECRNYRTKKFQVRLSTGWKIIIGVLTTLVAGLLLQLLVKMLGLL